MVSKRYAHHTKVFIKYSLAPNGLIEAIVEDYYNGKLRATALNYSVAGYVHETYTHSEESISITGKEVICSGSYVIPYSEGKSARILYGKK